MNVSKDDIEHNAKLLLSVVDMELEEYPSVTRDRIYIGGF